MIYDLRFMIAGLEKSLRVDLTVLRQSAAILKSSIINRKS